MVRASCPFVPREWLRFRDGRNGRTTLGKLSRPVATIFAVCLLGLFLPSPARGATYTNDFSTDPGWIGGFTTNGVMRYHIDPDGWGRGRAIGPGLWLTNGFISVRARATGTNVLGHTCIGVLIKYIGEGESINEYYLRIGPYGIISMDDNVLTSYTLALNQWHDIDIDVNGDQVAIALDDSPLPGSPFTVNTLANQPGRVGFYTEAAAEWDDLVVTGYTPVPGAMPLNPSGMSDLSLDFASYRADLPDPNEAFPVHGVLHLYLRNNGAGPAILDHALLNGVHGDIAIDAGNLAWYRMRPQWIKPGEVGDVSLRFNAFTKAQALPRMDDPAFEPAAAVTVVPTTGNQKKFVTALGTRAEPLQINFLGFSGDFQTIYAYVQNNRGLYDGETSPVTFDRVEVNGIDRTSVTTFGATTVTDNVIPLVIALPAPLIEGDWTVVTVHTKEGIACGHTLRAIASEFVVNVPYFTRQPRLRSDAEAAEDMYRHCVTAGTWMDEPDLVAEGLDQVVFSGHSSMGVNDYLPRMTPTSPPIQGNWFDEVDKEAIQPIFEMVERLDTWFSQDGTTYGRLVPNVIRPRSISGKAYNEMGDAIMHSYGLHTSPGLTYPLMDNFRWGEYRSARRVFWPYYRDAEMGILVDTNAMTATVPNPVVPRVLTPEEQGILVYGNLMLGAKSASYWGYSAIYAPEGELYTSDPQLRVGLGGTTYPATSVLHGFAVDTNFLNEIVTTWNAIGHLNAEMLTIGPWVARGDVSETARIVSVSPPTAPNGHPAAEASAIVSGLDTLILVVLNLNINASAGGGLASYDPVNVTAAVELPAWLAGQSLETFSVDVYDAAGIVDETAATTGDKLQFSYGALASKKIIVITSDSGVRPAMTATMTAMKARLAMIPPLP